MKNFRKNTGLAILGMLLLSACGGATGSSSGSSISSFTALPNATSPVVDSTTGSLSPLPSKSFSLGAEKAASTGLKLSQIGSSAFDNSSSRSMCEVGNLLKQTINDGGQADKIGCYMSKTMEANDYTVATICDGNTHIVGLDFPSGGDDQGPDHIKFSCTSSGGAITSYTMWACNGGTQNEYISKTIGNDGSVSITSIGNFTDGDGAVGWHSITASGELSGNNDGSYASKTITSNMRFVGDNNYTGQMTLEQNANSFVLSGFQNGTFSEGSFTNRMYSTGQLIENNTATDFDSYDIRNLAYGDGAANLILSSTFDENTFSMEEVQSWNGDTTEAEDSNDYTVAATAGTVPSVQSISISFTGDAAYDCNGTEEDSLTIPSAIANEDESNVCARFGLNHSWFDCYTLTGDNGE